MSWFEIFFYGVIQGMTEFLPVSSSGHLALIPSITAINDPGTLFDLSLHVGTAFSILFYFKKDVISIIFSFLKVLKNFKIQSTQESFAFNMFISTIVTVVAALLIKDFAISYGRVVSLIAFNLAFFGIVMALADHFSPVLEEGVMNRPRAGKAFLIGFFQVLALFPGVSRSGITLTVARLSGLSRVEASRFSFLLSLPLILGGMVYQTSSMEMVSLTFTLEEVLWGIGLSFVIGLLTIHYFLRFISRVGLLPFAIYRVFMALAIYGTVGH